MYINIGAPIMAVTTPIGNSTVGIITRAKISAQTIALWSRALHAVPNSKILLRNVGLDQPSLQRRILGHFESSGITPDRIQFLGRGSHSEFLATYNQIDIGLDTTPYSGGLTTLEAIWMGVPVLTRGGPNFASRHSITHLSHCGLERWVHETDDSFIQDCVYWSE